MSDDDENEGRLINFPSPDGILNHPPDLADPGRLFPAPDTPPESPEETTMEIPRIPAAPDPANSLRSEGIPTPDSGGENDGEEYEGEYEQPRSLADRLGDWLELRLQIARDRHDGEASFREAEIKRKVALLEAQTSRETSLAEAQNKLRQAHLKAQAGRAGKADASGMGADKGRSKPGGSGGGRGGAGNNSGGGRGSSGGTGSAGGKSGGWRGTSGGSGAGRDTTRSSSAGASGKNSGGGKGTGPGGGKGTGGGNGSGGRGSGGGKPGGKGSGSGGPTGPGGGRGGAGRETAASPAAERARGRQERRAARQAARQQRAAARQDAGLADRSKDRDQDRELRRAAQERAQRRAEKEHRRAEKERRRKRKEEKAARAAGREDRTTFGEALTEEAQRRWDKRRRQAASGTGNGRKGSQGSGPQVTTTKGQPKGSGGPSGGPGSATGAPGPGGRGKPGGGAPGGSGGGPGRSGKQRSRRAPSGTSGGAGRGKDSPFGRDRTPPTVEWPDGRPARPGTKPASEEDIVDAVIVDDPADPFGAYRSSPASLPRAPEPHTQRPGTTRPTAQEDSVASEVNKTASGQAGMAAKHRTDITFDEYLVEIVNIAIAAALDKDRAQELAVALGKVADALRDMAADLVGDHNIATEVVNQITDLADAATRMKQLAERCATECEIASEAARIAAMSVGRVYGEDIQAMDDAGLAHASAAAHHD